ncbi:FAD-binding protein [Pectobacteriaceae bacterium CE70]|nr:FAD-binding protein [Pectobacteriaceae bacterium CE70]WJY11023.1 FAD-binding protein [Pectobacteriaceae bacterium C80]
MKKYDVILIGGGIAGLMSAYKLCEIGLSVALVEKKKCLLAALQPAMRDGYTAVHIMQHQF